MIKRVVKENIGYLLGLFFIVACYYIVFNTSLYSYIIDFDYKIIEIVNKIENTGLTAFFKVITNTLGFYLPIFILFYLLFLVKNKWYFYVQAISYTSVMLLTLLFKFLIARPRPIIALIKMPVTYSFPSGHTISAIFFYSLLCYILTIKSNQLVRNAFFILFSFVIFLVAISRVYLGVHFFSDVIGGLLFGVTCVLLAINIIEKNYKEKLI